MTSEELRAIQAPLKQRYRTEPAAALVTSSAVATLDQGRIACRVLSPQPGADVGLHSAAGGDGLHRCSADMVLEALVGCAGVTLLAVATAMGITIRSGTIRAEGDWDARGTLGVSKEVPVGLLAVRLKVSLDSSATAEQHAKLLQLTERYCVVAQTLAAGVRVEVG
jgi:uncharacterized OsmC-like protein